MANSPQGGGSQGVPVSVFSTPGARQRLQRKRSAVEFKSTQHMENEDKRVKQLTEAVLYEFLPTALNVMLPHCEDPLQDLDAGRCRAVAGAALAVAALMNAPPGFLEFLLCVPWRKLTQLYPKSDTIDKLISNLHVTDDERKRLVNMRIEPALMRVVLDFLYRPEHVHSLPPMLAIKQPSPSDQAADEAPEDGSATLETVAAVLDGATPLHCAALRGNPAQVDHLLFCGADPACRTTAGELAIQLVPVCSNQPAGSNGRVCRCMGPVDQEKWECKSRLARSLIAQRLVTSPWLLGIWGWLKMLMLCVLCTLGLWGNYTTICRPLIEQHVLTRRERKKQGARIRAQNLMIRMRSEAQQGHVHLATAKQEAAARAQPSGWQQAAGLNQDGTSSDPSTTPRIDLLMQANHRQAIAPGQAAAASSVADVVDLTFANKPPPAAAPTSIHDINVHLKESEAIDALGEEQASEKAFKCFVRAVHSLQSLDLQGETIPQVLNEPAAPGEPISSSAHILEDEQAVLYCCWAESVMLKFGRTCTCPGCAALAVQAVRMAHAQTSKLYQRAEAKHGGVQAERVRGVGHCLARVVHVYITLLLDSEAQCSPTRASVWRAEQCLREWDRLAACGLADEGFSAVDLAKVGALRLWARTADSDLYIAEALLGTMLGPAQSLQEVLAMTVVKPGTAMPYLARGVNAEVVHQLEQALTLALLPSPSLSHLAKALVQSSSQELAVGVRLREVISSTRMPTNEDTADFILSLEDIIAKAEVFPRLAGDAAISRGILEKCSARADAVGKLMSVLDDVRQYTETHPLLPPASHISSASSASGPSTLSPTSSATATSKAAQANADPGKGAARTGPPDAGSSGGDGGAGEGAVDGVGLGPQAAPDLNAWDEKLKVLEAAIQEAKDATIGVAKAKRLLKELQAQATAAKAASQLEVVLSKKPAGAAALKAGLTKAEAAASALSGIGIAGSTVGQAIQALVLSAKRRLEVERALDALSKACSSCKAVGDLAKLEAAIINARKVGAEDLDPEVYRTASDLRAKLTEAGKARAALDTTLRAVQKTPRQEDVEALEKAIIEGSKWEDLLAHDLTKARDALGAWKSQTATEAKLARALRDGAPLPTLSRAIADAAAAGVKVQHARKVFKLLQGVEQALGATGDGPAALLSLLRSRSDAAEQGGVPPSHPILAAAQHALKRLLAADARDALEAALKQGGDSRAYERLNALRAALSKAEEVVGAAAIASVCQDSSSSATPSAPSSREPSLTSANSLDHRSSKRSSQGGGNGASSSSVPALPTATSIHDTATPATSRTASCSAPLDMVAAAAAGVVTDEAGGDHVVVASADSAASLLSEQLMEPAGSMISVTISDDDADMAMLLELARRARGVMEEDQREISRQEAERAAAEKERKERQEREKAERARADQERKQREQEKRDEASKRDRASGEKRAPDKARPDKASRSKVTGTRVDLASISASSHFSTSSAASSSSGHPAAPAAMLPGKVPPPPPPPPPHQAQRREGRQGAADAPAVVAVPAMNGAWKNAISGAAAGQAARQQAAGQPQPGGAGRAGEQAVAEPAGPPAAAAATTGGAQVVVPPSPRLSAAAPTFVMPTPVPNASKGPSAPGMQMAGKRGAQAVAYPMDSSSHGGADPALLQPGRAGGASLQAPVELKGPLAALAQHQQIAAAQHQQQQQAAALAALYQQQQQAQHQQQSRQHLTMAQLAAAAAAAVTAPGHSRVDSLECLGDPTLKLDRAMLEALDLSDLDAAMQGGAGPDPSATTAAIPASPRFTALGAAQQDASSGMLRAPTTPKSFSPASLAPLPYGSVFAAPPPQTGAAAAGAAGRTPAGVRADERGGAGRAAGSRSVADDTNSHSSMFSSAASTDDVLAGHMARPDWAAQDKLHQEQLAAGAGPAAANKPRYGLVDLGGMTWGLDNKFNGGSGGIGTGGGGGGMAQADAMAEFHSILGENPRQAAGGGHGGGGAAAQELGGLFGWSAAGQVGAAGWQAQFGGGEGGGNGARSGSAGRDGSGRPRSTSLWGDIPGAMAGLMGDGGGFKPTDHNGNGKGQQHHHQGGAMPSRLGGVGAAAMHHAPAQHMPWTMAAHHHHHQHSDQQLLGGGHARANVAAAGDGYGVPSGVHTDAGLLRLATSSTLPRLHVPAGSPAGMINGHAATGGLMHQQAMMTTKPLASVASGTLASGYVADHGMDAQGQGLRRNSMGYGVYDRAAAAAAAAGAPSPVLGGKASFHSSGAMSAGQVLEGEDLNGGMAAKHPMLPDDLT